MKRGTRLTTDIAFELFERIQDIDELTNQLDEFAEQHSLEAVKDLALYISKNIAHFADVHMDVRLSHHRCGKGAVQGAPEAS